ncbi:MAG: DUF2793 domain-containing protein [Pseudomonadota bacterium]
MSETSPNLALPYIQPAQAQKHVTANESFRRLDALTQLAVLSRQIATPPGSPANGDRYIMPAGAAGDWSSAGVGDVAAWQDGGWLFYPPEEGWRADVADEARTVVYRSGGWRAEAESPNSASSRLAIIEIDHAVSSGPISDTAAVIPDRAVVFAVSALVVGDVTGAASWDLGVAGATDRYGTAIAIGAGTAFVGPSAQPVGYYADTALRLTANGGDFTGGTVRLAVHALLSTAPA